MKKIKGFWILVVLIIPVIFTGCNFGFDASAYVKGTLDVIFKGEITEEYLKLVEETRSETEEEREKEIDKMMESFDGTGMSEELLAKYEGYMNELLKLVDYEVGEAKKEGDAYIVPVTARPILVDEMFEKAMGLAETELTAWAMDFAASGGTYEETEVMEKTYETLYNHLDELLNSVTYGESQEYEIRVEKGSDGKYEPDEDDVEDVFNGMLEMGSFF